MKMNMELTNRWVAVKDGSPLELTIGTHDIRFVFKVDSSKREWPSIASNTVEITITKALSAAEEAKKVRELRKRAADAAAEGLRKKREAIEKQKNEKKNRNDE